MKKLLLLSGVVAALMCSYSASASDFDRVYQTGTPLEAPRVMPQFRELKHALKMPDFELKNLYGQPVKLSDFKGKIVVLNLWATWCRPCIAEIPEIISAQKQLKNSDIKIIGVALDGANVNLQKFLDRIQAGGLETWIDAKSAIAGKMSVSVVPSNFILDGEGNIVGFAEGYVPWDNPKVISFLKELSKKYVKPVKGNESGKEPKTMGSV